MAMKTGLGPAASDNASIIGQPLGVGSIRLDEVPLLLARHGMKTTSGVSQGLHLFGGGTANDNECDGLGEGKTEEDDGVQACLG
jgi:hypothetical protein